MLKRALLRRATAEAGFDAAENIADIDVLSSGWSARRSPHLSAAVAATLEKFFAGSRPAR
jgi:hypothetical protein